MTQKHILCILDGWGLSNSDFGNAIAAAHTPTFDRLMAQNHVASLDASGPAVGLPEGQMGNSEVGHLTIGAGRPIAQDIVRINQGLSGTALDDHSTLNTWLSKQKALHVMCLLSDGGVHSHIDHLLRILDHLNHTQLAVHIHVITDGRDTPPDSGLEFLKTLLTFLKDKPHQKIATLGGAFTTWTATNAGIVSKQY